AHSRHFTAPFCFQVDSGPLRRDLNSPFRKMVGDEEGRSGARTRAESAPDLTVPTTRIQGQSFDLPNFGSGKPGQEVGTTLFERGDKSQRNRHLTAPTVNPSMNRSRKTL